MIIHSKCTFIYTYLGIKSQLLLLTCTSLSIQSGVNYVVWLLILAIQKISNPTLFFFKLLLLFWRDSLSTTLWSKWVWQYRCPKNTKSPEGRTDSFYDFLLLLDQYGEEMDAETKPGQLSSLSWDSDSLEEWLIWW